MLVEEICKKLRPIHGRKIDRLWQAYSIENIDGKRDIEQMLQLLYAKTFPEGIGQEEQSLLMPPPEDLVRGEYPVGTVTYARKKLFTFGLREDDWIKHMLIVGASGSGKTNLCFQVLKSFLKNEKPFIVCDWKRSYRDLLQLDCGKDIQVYTVGRNVVPFRFNPLIPPPGTSAKNYLKLFINSVCVSTFTGEGVAFLLQKALDQLYEQSGMYDDKPVKQYPTLHDLLDVISNMDSRNRESGWKSSALRALGALTYGESGKVFNTRHQEDLSGLLSKNVILELDGLTTSDKVFFVNSFLLYIYRYKLSSPSGKRECFDSALVLEEAHNISGDSTNLTGAENITDIMFRMVRELGLSLLVIDQSPSLLSLPARANTWCTIALNLKDSKDVNSAASTLLMDSQERKLLGRLETGEAVVKLQGRWHRPFTIDISLVPLEKGRITDEKLKELMRPYSSYSILEEDELFMQDAIPENQDPRKKKIEISDEENKLLEDIQKNPYSGVVERYKRIGWSRRKGNEFKKSLTEKKLIDTVEIPTQSGRVVILKLKIVAGKKADISRNEIDHKTRTGGITHEYWKNKYAEIYREKGYKVTIEEPVGRGKTVDLTAKKGNTKIAIEIETGRSDIGENISKCMKIKYNKMIVVAINERIVKEISEVIKKNMYNKDSIEIRCARTDSFFK